MRRKREPSSGANRNGGKRQLTFKLAEDPQFGHGGTVFSARNGLQFVAKGFSGGAEGAVVDGYKRGDTVTVTLDGPITVTKVRFGEPAKPKGKER